MNKLSLAILTAATAVLAQPQLSPVPPAPQPLPPGTTRPMPVRLPPGGMQPEAPRLRPEVPKTNYRIRVEIREGKDAPMEINVVTSEGKVRTQMINPKRTVIDDREVPSSLDLTATLNPLEEDKCQLTLFLGRSVPYATGRTSGPEGKGYSQYQQMQLGLDTTVILQVGKSLVIQSDPTQQIKVTLEKPTD
jgi:hypothetical protein